MSYRIDPRAPLTLEVRRIAAEEIAGAVAELEAARGDPGKAVHNCRKRLKSLRALLRLVRPGDKDFFRAENGRYRDIAASLAGPREATALIETVDRLAAAFPEETAGDGLDAARDALVARRGQLLRDEAILLGTIAAATEACHAGVAALAGLSLPDDPEAAADVLAAGAKTALQRGRRALERARKQGEPEDFHDLRKAIKTHVMHLGLLQRLWPGSVKARRKAVDALGQRLGDLNDVFVMRSLIESDDQPLGGRGETALLRKLLRRSERDLRKQCLSEAAHLFDESPKSAARKLARKCRQSLSESAPTTAS